jgi:tubulin-like protein CetZ
VCRMLRIGFMGIGQAGGRFCQLAKAAKYQSIVLNTAQVDLDGLTGIEPMKKLHLKGYEGAGKDRFVAKEAFDAHVAQIRHFASTHLADMHIICVAAALGGGTGSGMVKEVAELLCDIFPSKVIMTFLFLPMQDESLKNKMNAIEAFSEISAVEDTGAMFLASSDIIKERHRNMPLYEQYTLASMAFLSDLYSLQQKTKMQSVYSNIDDMDVLTALSERGCAMLSSFTYDDPLDSSTIQSRMEASWRYNMLQVGETTEIAKAVIVVEATSGVPELSTLLPSGIKPYELYQGAFLSGTNKVTTLLTGMALPYAIMRRYQEDVEQDEKQVEKMLHKRRTERYETDRVWTEQMRRKRNIRV